MKAKELIKVLLSEQKVQQKELAQLMTEQSNKEYTPSGLSHKIGRGTISYDEVLLIADILGYEINITRKS